MNSPHPAFGHPLPSKRGEGKNTHLSFSPLGEKVADRPDEGDVKPHGAKRR
jgi:hypothetical protein